MEFKEHNPLIFIIAGKARTGKNTVSHIINQYYNYKGVELSYTTYLKKYVELITNKEILDSNKPRTLLQEIGTELIKNKIDNKLLIRRTIEDIKVLSYFKDIIIISGARRKDEIEDIKSLFPYTISIKLTSQKSTTKLDDNQKAHITETDLDNYNKFDYIIENEENIDVLKNRVYDILNEVKYE